MLKKLTVVCIAAFVLTGCSTAGDYYKSVDTSNARNVEMVKAQAAADVARYQALAQIAQSGDSAAKVAATMAIAMSGNVGQQRQAAVAQPMQSEALQWASVLVPGVTQGLSIYYNTKAQMNASDNATALGMNTNSTFATFASEINDPTVVMQPTPTVVTQPTPITVTQPAPIIVRPEVVNPVVIQ